MDTTDTMNLKTLIHPLREIARAAGREAMTYYGGDTTVEKKADDSPLTLADRAAHARITAALADLTPKIPVLSEEDAEHAGYETRRGWERFWVVDPLDGTKEFIRGTGQFTVNIALVEHGRPILGVVHAPAMERTYLAARGMGAFRIDGEGDSRPIRARPWSRETLRIVASRDHAGPVVSALLEHLGEVETASMGSSLKFCLVAEGEADLYLRDVPTMEWDTAAAQCVLENAGGRVLTLEGEPLDYNKEILRNPALISIGDLEIPWQEWLGAATAAAR
jgi:3'(2'), 5'-bisphosphate nucleotidase